ncbi:MAG TPA: ribonucleotide-diphosphate reductase subunit beta [Candidatus Dormibacteraeota bacterium]|nr:ribonucleotide-diphosphate reductase subunit beta [Candidatus Dormibacteraeota bacterium]
MEQTHEIVRRVEEAPLQDLLRLSLDEVQVQMDSYLDPTLDPLALYRRWERQQWAVADLDLAEDVSHWERLDGSQRDAVRRTMILFFIGEQAVTDTLSPILHAAPREDERIFLATQIADEARHAVFFQRYFEEVLGIGGGLHAALGRIGPERTAGFRQIFDRQLAAATERVRVAPSDRGAWVEAVVTYHLIIEGYLALAGQRNLLRFFRGAGLLPGFTTGFTAVARDESRHIGFGVLALRRRVAEDPAQARVIARQVLELSEPTVLTVVNPEQRLQLPDPGHLPALQRQSPLEAREFSIGSLARRLRSIGISEGVVDQIQDRYRGLYERLWARYEEIHGIEHPVRWYQRQAEAS